MKTGRWVLQSSLMGKSCEEDMEMGTTVISDEEVL